MQAEVTAALIAAVVSMAGVIVTYITTSQQRKQWLAEFRAQELHWQESFRAELRQQLVQESTLETVRTRIRLYGEVWRALKITSQYEWRHLPDTKTAVKNLADRLTDFAYSEVGLVMTDRSRRLLTSLRRGCGHFLRDEVDAQELINRAHLLKHSMRSDLGIITEEYESELDRIATLLGRVDDWRT